MIEVFSPVWFVLMAVIAVLVFVCGRIARNKDRRGKLHFMAGLAGLTIVYWILYKIGIANDPEFEFVLIKELPLHLCNIVMIVALIAALADIRVLQSMCFYFGTVGAMFAMLTPDADFVNIALFSTRAVGYWGYHMLVVVLCLSFASTGTYEPRYKDIPKACLALAAFGLGAHILNCILRPLVCPDVNYFYTFGIEGNPITELLHSIIPVNFLFMVPMLIPVGGVAAAMTWLARLGKKSHAIK